MALLNLLRKFASEINNNFILLFMRLLNNLLFVIFAMSANAADGTLGTVSVQKGNNVSVNGEAPLSLTLDGKDHQSCQFLIQESPR